MKKKLNEPVPEAKVIAGGKEYKLDDPAVLGTKPIRLSRSQPIKAVNMFLPPGVSRFYVQRLSKNEIRFLIRTDEVERLADKAEEMMGKKKKKVEKAVEAIKDEPKSKAEA